MAKIRPIRYPDKSTQIGMTLLLDAQSTFVLTYA
jgi:hypothetical protein